VLNTVILVFEEVRAIRSVRMQRLLGIFQMNTFVRVPLEENIGQQSAGKYDQWRRYRTVLVINHGIIKSIGIVTAVIRAMLNVDVDIPRDCFCHEDNWTLEIH
jgi:hypothetical protein